MHDHMPVIPGACYYYTCKQLITHVHCSFMTLGVVKELLRSLITPTDFHPPWLYMCAAKLRWQQDAMWNSCPPWLEETSASACLD